MKQAYNSKAVNNAEFNSAAQNQSCESNDKDRRSHVGLNPVIDDGFQFCSYP